MDGELGFNIYVDDLVNCAASKKWPYRQACHLFTDVHSLELLHQFARQLGLKRAWFQQHGTMPHYDLTASKRIQAIKSGATWIGREKTAEIIRSWRQARKSAKSAGTSRSSVQVRNKENSFLELPNLNPSAAAD